MEIIEQQYISSVDSMTNEDSSFPMENAIDGRPGKVAKSTSTTTVIGMTGRGTAISFFNPTATSGTITVVDNDSAVKTTGVDISITGPSTITRASGSFVTDGFTTGEIFLKGFTADNNNGFFTISSVSALTIVVTETSLTTEGSASGRQVISMEVKVIDAQELKFITFKSYTQYFLAKVQTNPHHIVEFGKEVWDFTAKFTMTGATNVSIGMIFGGYLVSYGFSQFGSGFQPEDFSIFTTTSGGSLAQTSRAVIQNMPVIVRCDLRQADMLLRFIDGQGANFSVFRMRDSSKFAGQFIRFGTMQLKPRLTYGKPGALNYSVTVRQVI